LRITAGGCGEAGTGLRAGDPQITVDTALVGGAAVFCL
jgi:hypothetical protein